MKVIKQEGAEPYFPQYHFVGDPVDNRWFVFSKGHPDARRIMEDPAFARTVFLKLTS